MHIELLGGLGDCLNRLYSVDWMPKLLAIGAREIVDVTINSHNPYVDELFKWHPKRSQLVIRKLAFHYPWTDQDWRKVNGLPPSPDLPYSPQEKIDYFPPLHEYEVLGRFSKKPFLVFVISAGTKERHIPESIREEMSLLSIGHGFTVCTVGRRYRHNEEHDTGNRHTEETLHPRKSVVNLIDCLSLPGTAKLIERAAGVVTTHTSMCLMSWFMKKPTFLLYGDHARDVLLPLGNVGYMAGVGRPGNDSMHFGEYTADRFSKWIEERK